MSTAYDAARRQATAAQTAATGKRWCNSCHVYRPEAEGRMRTVKAGRGFTKQWRCGVCVARRAAQPEAAAPNGRLAAFLAPLEAAKPEQPNYRRYGELKRQLESEFAGLPPADYERAIAIIARATGV